MVLVWVISHMQPTRIYFGLCELYHRVLINWLIKYLILLLGCHNRTPNHDSIALLFVIVCTLHPFIATFTWFFYIIISLCWNLFSFLFFSFSPILGSLSIVRSLHVVLFLFFVYLNLTHTYIKENPTLNFTDQPSFFLAVTRVDWPMSLI